MKSEPLEIEGFWEDVAALGSRFSGRRVKLTVMPPEEPEPTEPKDTRTIEEKIMAHFADVPAEEWAKFPEDFGENMDHYLYGTPKRGNGLVNS